nr:kinesin-like protein KIN-14S [Tanacetum cinerariifolium]
MPPVTNSPTSISFNAEASILSCLPFKPKSYLFSYTKHTLSGYLKPYNQKLHIGCFCLYNGGLDYLHNYYYNKGRVPDPVFVRLLYDQLVHDYRSGNYSELSKADVKKLSALLILGEIGYDAHASLRSNWRLIRDQSKPFYTHRGYDLGNQLLRDIETTYLSLIDKDWFHPIEASLKRARIKRMIFELAKTNVQHGSSPGCNAKSSYELKDKDDAEDAEEQPNSLKSASLALEEVEGCHPAAKVRQMKQLVHAMEVAFQNFKKSSQEDYEILKNRLDLECAERRRLHNELIELKGNIRVFCRCRPLNRDEIARGLTSVVDFDSSLENELKIVGADSSEKQFKFDHIFRPEDNHGSCSDYDRSVSLYVSLLLVSVLDGFNVCIFAYGQTGTGKTFRMEGTAENRGVNYRTLEKLFSLSEERSDTMRYEMSVSMLEIYNEKIRDLLVKDAKQPAKKLKVKLSTEGTHEVSGLSEVRVHNTDEVWNLLKSGSHARSVGSTSANEFSSRSHWLNVKELEVPGLNEVRVLETGDVWKLLKSGSSARSVGSTNVNEFSSRSHCLLRVTVDGKNLVNGQETRSRLWLVDLARSERAGKTGAQGDRLKEANNINKSLSELRNVISALASKASHIPYRNSKLTHVLQGSLGGDSKTLIFVQISPSQADLGETLSSLRFARDVGVVVRVPARKRFAARQKKQKKKAAVASSHLPISSTILITTVGILSSNLYFLGI